MKKFFSFLAFSFIILFFINVIWIGINLYLWSTKGLQAMFQDMNFVERIYFSILLKWIILADMVWVASLIIFILKRKKYKTNTEYYLENKPIKNPKISVVNWASIILKLEFSSGSDVIGGTTPSTIKSKAV